MRLRGLGDATVVVWGGDGSTCDIGFSGVSAAAERNEDFIYVLNDNEAYMNTGVQKSGATPEGAWTTTTPAGAPRTGQKKDIARIMAAHRIPYVATLAAGSLPMLKDFRAKVARAAEVRGFRFLQVLGACPPGWRYPTAQSTEIARLAVESRYFPLFECDDGEWRITYRPKHEVPVREFLETQGRFSHLSAERDRLDPGSRGRALGAARRDPRELLSGNRANPRFPGAAGRSPWAKSEGVESCSDARATRRS